MYMETTLKTLVNIQKESDKVIGKIEKLNGKLWMEGADKFHDNGNVQGIDIQQVEEMNEPDRKVVINMSSWFHLRNPKMKGELKSNGIYRTFVTKISKEQGFPVIIDIPETVWRKFGKHFTPTTEENAYYWETGSPSNNS